MKTDFKASVEPDAYDVLGVERTATQAEIKSAYRELAKRLHPDLGRERSVRGYTIEQVTTAYDKIGDPVDRKTYDDTYKQPITDDLWDDWDDLPDAGPGTKPPSAPPKPKPKPKPGPAPTPAGDEDDMPPMSAIRGADVVAEVWIPRDAAKSGVRRKILVLVDGKSVSMIAAIPAGVRNGQKVVLRGRGCTGERGGANGDVLVTVWVTDAERGRDRKGEVLLLRSESRFWLGRVHQVVDAATGSPIGQFSFTAGEIAAGKADRPGAGDAGKKGGTAGDLHIEFKIVEDQSKSDSTSGNFGLWIATTMLGMAVIVLAAYLLGQGG